MRTDTQQIKKQEAAENRGADILHLLGNIVLFLLAAVISFTVYVYREEINIINIRRLISYIDIGLKSDMKQNRSISFYGGTKNSIKSFKDGLAVLSNDGIVVYGPDGRENWRLNDVYQDPNMKVSSKYIMAYDSRKGLFNIVNGYSTVYSKHFKSSIFSASINNNGWISVACAEDGYKGSVLVISPDMREVYKWYSANDYLVNSDVSFDGKRLAAGVVGTGEENMISYVVFFDTLREGELQRIALNDELVLDIKYDSKGRLRVVTDKGIYFIDKNMQVESSYKPDKKYIVAFDMSDEISVLFERVFKVGQQSTMKILDMSGKETASIEIEGDMRSISVCEKYVGTLINDRLEIYEKNGKLIFDRSNLSQIQKIVIKDSQTIILIKLDSAEVVKFR